MSYELGVNMSFALEYVLYMIDSFHAMICLDVSATSLLICHHVYKFLLSVNLVIFMPRIHDAIVFVEHV